MATRFPKTMQQHVDVTLPKELCDWLTAEAEREQRLGLTNSRNTFIVRVLAEEKQRRTSGPQPLLAATALRYGYEAKHGRYAVMLNGDDDWRVTEGPGVYRFMDEADIAQALMDDQRRARMEALRTQLAPLSVRSHP